MKKRLSFDAILATAGPGRPGYQTWFEKLDEATQSELGEIKRRWHESGKKPPAATMARAIVKHCKEAGIDVAGETQVGRWLRTN
jgi:hypothetical protein